MLIEEAANFKIEEFAIVAYFESTAYWNVITTQAIIVHNDFETFRINAADIENFQYGDFKGIVTGKKTETMEIKLKNGITTGFKYETGSLSMGAIYGISTLLTVRYDGNDPAV